MPEYHKYVFDTVNRKFVGQFEEMYRAEDTEGFDSWFERDLRYVRKTLSYTILSAYNFSTVLDLGCGKGSFTHLLKKRNNRVVGIDASATAILKALQSYPDIDFVCADIHGFLHRAGQFDLVVTMGTFAYIEDWPDLIAAIARVANWFYVAEYIPSNPIGFVKSSDHLLDEVQKYFRVVTKVLLDDEHCLVLSSRNKHHEGVNGALLHHD
jgi:SAM-dependent methyltransferase